jgi:uncharacterized protein
MAEYTITSVDALRAILGHPSQLVIDKAISEIDAHCAKFIAASPFLLIGTADASGRQDVSPKGDPPGFVKIVDPRTLVIPERPGNRRADTLTNVIANPAIALLFLIPNVEDSLRVNGRAEVSTDPSLRAQCVVNGHMPDLVIVVHVEEVFLHCAKCIKRSKLWRSGDAPADVSTLAEAVRDHAKSDLSVEQLQAAIDESYRTKMY